MIERELSDGRVWDVCVVGTGPVGMAMALEFERLGEEVLLVESGGNEADSSALPMPRGRRSLIRAAMRRWRSAVCRALGGTSWTWGGRCVAYDDIDWVQRASWRS